MTGDGLSLLEQRLEKKVEGKPVSFDPLTIISIIASIILMIQNCQRPSARGLRRRLFNRARLAAGLREKVGGLSWRESLGLADDVFDLADEAKDDELQMLILDCCSERANDVQELTSGGTKCGT
jgi:hypothetical protein